MPTPEDLGLTSIRVSALPTELDDAGVAPDADWMYLEDASANVAAKVHPLAIVAAGIRSGALAALAPILAPDIDAATDTLVVHDLSAGIAKQVTVAALVSLAGGGAPSGDAGGDLGGTYPNPSVTALNGAPITAGATGGQVLVYTEDGGGAWEPADPPTGGSSIAAGVSVDPAGLTVLSGETVQDALADADAGIAARVPIAGGTMTGPLALAQIQNAVADGALALVLQGAAAVCSVTVDGVLGLAVTKTAISAALPIQAPTIEANSATGVLVVGPSGAGTVRVGPRGAGGSLRLDTAGTARVTIDDTQIGIAHPVAMGDQSITGIGGLTLSTGDVQIGAGRVLDSAGRQLNPPLIQGTASTTLTLADTHHGILRCTDASGCTVTVPAGLTPDTCVTMFGIAGAVTLSVDASYTEVAYDSTSWQLATSGAGAALTVTVTSATSLLITGELAEAP